MKTTPSNHNTIKSSESVSKVSPCRNHTQLNTGGGKKGTVRGVRDSSQTVRVELRRLKRDVSGSTQSWWETARRHSSDGGTRAAHGRRAERRRDAPELGGGGQRVRTPAWTGCVPHPKITLFAFVYFEVSFVLCSGHFCFISQTTGTRWTSKASILLPWTVAMVLRENIPPAAAFLDSRQPQKRRGHG